MNKIKNKYMLFPLILGIISLIMLSILTYSPKYKQEKSYVGFLSDLNSDKVTKVYVTDSPLISVTLKSGKTYKTDNPRSSDFKETVLSRGIQVSEYEPNYLAKKVAALGILVSIVCFFILTLSSGKSISKTLVRHDALDIENNGSTNVKFSDIAGMEEAKESVKDVIDFLKNPEKYNTYGARMPKGIILYGEPGTGKTLLAKAVATEAGVPFFAMSGSDFVQVYVGVGASRVRQLFKKARNSGKAVIFIDEIDAIGKKRDKSSNGGSEEKDQTLNALLTEMSGFNEKEGIVVMAATNRVDILDSALLRPGRFDRHIEISLPDVAAREKILNLYLENKPIKNIDINKWAKNTVYFSGAKLENLVNEAAIIACKEKSGAITDIEMDKAYSNVMVGYEKVQRNYITEDEKKLTAYHEAGHALMTLIKLPEDKVSKVSIIPSTKGAGGYTMSIPQDKMFHSYNYLKFKIMVLLSGRAAEDIIFGKENITTGAYNDLTEATKIVTSMISQYGMGKDLGLLNLNILKEAGASSPDISSECKSMINSIYKEAKETLSANLDVLKNIAKSLIEKESIYDLKLSEFKS